VSIHGGRLALSTLAASQDAAAAPVAITRPLTGMLMFRIIK